MAISEQLDLISKEIGGKLDDNGNIEKQVQEIYNIIKSGAWPSGGGGSYELPTAGDDTKGGVKIPSGGYLTMDGEELRFRYTSYKVGIGFMNEYDGSGNISSSDDEIPVTEAAWVIISLRSAASYNIAYTVKIYIEDENDYIPIISDVIPAQTSGPIKLSIPCDDDQNLKVDTTYGPVTVSYEKYTMGYRNFTIGN